jgi:hypothetical protein
MNNNLVFQNREEEIDKAEIRSMFLRSIKFCEEDAEKKKNASLELSNFSGKDLI